MRVTQLNTYVDYVIECAVLGSAYEGGLMVRGSVNRGHAIGTNRQTASDVSREGTVNSRVIQSLEELENRGIERRGRIDRWDCLYDKMRVSFDVVGASKLLGRSEIVLIGVDEEARVEIVDGHLDGEVLVRGDGAHVRGEYELGRRHVGRRCDETHRCGVA